MKKATLLFGAIFAIVFSFSASAAEMVRYEYKYYKSGKNPEAKEQKYVPEEEQFSKRKYEARKVSSKKQHPMFNRDGLFKDR